MKHDTQSRFKFNLPPDVLISDEKLSVMFDIFYIAK